MLSIIARSALPFHERGLAIGRSSFLGSIYNSQRSRFLRNREGSCDSTLPQIGAAMRANASTDPAGADVSGVRCETCEILRLTFLLMALIEYDLRGPQCGKLPQFRRVFIRGRKHCRNFFGSLQGLLKIGVWFVTGQGVILASNRPRVDDQRVQVSRQK